MAAIKVEGTIEKFFPSGSGFIVVEKRKDGDREFTDRFTVWSKQNDGLALGDKVAVTGRPSASGFTGDDGKVRGSIGINEPKITKADDVF